MLAKEKVALINYCIKISKKLPGKTIYGFIDIFGDVFAFEEDDLSYVLEEVGTLYCKAKNGNLIL